MASPATTTSTSDSDRPKVRTLQQISAAKTIDTLENDPNVTETLFNLSEEEKQVLLPHIWEEHLRLRKVERISSAAQEPMPAVDRDIYFCTPAEGIAAKRNGNSTQGATSQADRNTRRRSFQAKWRRCSVPELGLYLQLSEKDHETWTDNELVVMSNKRIRLHDEELPRFNESSRDFSTLISSQSLLYRLVAVFGNPQYDRPPTSKIRWRYDLTMCDTGSYLMLWDCSGRIELDFDGLRTDSPEALKLLNWLVGKEVLPS